MEFKKIRYAFVKIIFSILSPFYDKLTVLTVAHPNREIVKICLSRIINLKNMRVLDLGCGTGLWSKTLSEFGAEVEGVDFSNKSLYHAEKKYGDDIDFRIMDINNLDKICEKSYDIVTSAFVFHGLDREDRKNILQQLERITKGYILIYDFTGQIPPIPELMEILEGSDYIDFIKNFYIEMKNIYSNVQKIELLYGAGLYIASLNDEEQGKT